MFQPSGGLSCSTPSPRTCILTGVCPPGGGGCFLPGTMVKTEDGYRAIEGLKTGDRVIGLSESNGLVSCKVLKTYISINCDYYVINGEIRVTGTHPFRVNGRWVTVSEVKIGDRLQRIDSVPVEVVSIEHVNKPVRVYNIEVADAHTFFVNGVLVHNKGPDPGQQ